MEQEDGLLPVLCEFGTQSFPVVEVLLFFPIQSLYIGLAVQQVVAVKGCHLFLFSVCSKPCSVLSCPAAVQAIDHESIVQESFFRTVPYGKVADIAVFIVDIADSDASLSTNLPDSVFCGTL